jgi:predicted DNA-binding protein
MLVNPSPAYQPRGKRPSIRMDARLDAMTRDKVDNLATYFRRPRAAVLRHIMHWGLSHGQTGTLDQGESQGPVRHLSLYVESKLHARVEKAAAAAGVNIAPWLRHMVRQVAITDFPAHWQKAIPGGRSHDSIVYEIRFMLRLNEASRTRLEALVEHFDILRAAIIRHLIAQVIPEDFPKSWQMRANERDTQHARQIVPR